LGHPRLHCLRAILDAIFHVLKSGCPWRLLPRDFPPWTTVYDWFRRRWCIDGTWERLNTELRERLRLRLGRDPNPRAGIVDSRSAKTTGVGGEARGYDGGKKVRGRKRHLLVDTEGLIPKASRATAPRSPKVPDQDGIKKLLLKAVRQRLPRLTHLWVDAGYQGRGKKEWVEKELGLSVEVVHRTPKPTSEKIARIWAEEWLKEGKEID
jgi:putative transposase